MPLPSSRTMPLCSNSCFSSRSSTNSNTPISQKPQAMCVLTPHQFTCADPFGEHVCGSGYYFHFRAVCHCTPACTKYYTAPIMSSTSCGICEQVNRYHSSGDGAVPEGCRALTSYSSVGSCEASSYTGRSITLDETIAVSQGSGSTPTAYVEGAAFKL
jgi:hypothetical protein